MDINPFRPSTVSIVILLGDCSCLGDVEAKKMIDMVRKNIRHHFALVLLGLFRRTIFPNYNPDTMLIVGTKAGQLLPAWFIYQIRKSMGTGGSELGDPAFVKQVSADFFNWCRSNPFSAAQYGLFLAEDGTVTMFRQKKHDSKIQNGVAA